MKRTMLSIVMLFATLPFTAKADSVSEYQYDRVVIECRGYVDKFSVFIESFIDPKNTASAVTNLEIGYVVKTWKPVEYEYYETPQVNSASFEVEGSVSGGAGTFNVKYPWYEYTGKNTNFKTAVTLKTSIVQGNVEVTCKASLQKIKTKSEVQW